jgi:riboflavin synthase
MRRMFTGIIEETGRIVGILPILGDSIRMTLESDSVAKGVVIGDSVAVNGCCLTVVDIDGNKLSFDLLGETVRCTSILAVGRGALVNLERSVPVGGRMGGHFVSGHVDGTGIVKSIEREKDDIVIRVQAPEEIRKYIVYKGSIAIDGISLTVAGVDGDSFHVCLIPHTMGVTNLKDRKAGDRVNLESDMLARYVEGLMKASGK